MATIANLTIDQGSTFSMQADLSDGGSTIVDLSGWTARGTIRKSYGASGSVLFITEIVDDDLGELKVSLASDVTAALKPGRYVYDVEIYDGGTPPDVKRIIEGSLEITPSVTQANPTGGGIG
jgi:hypothetical protein